MSGDRRLNFRVEVPTGSGMERYKVNCDWYDRVENGIHHFYNGNKGSPDHHTVMYAPASAVVIRNVNRNE